MDIFAPRNPLKIVLSVGLIAIAAVLLFVGFTMDLKQYQYSLCIVTAVAILFLAIWAFLAYFNSEVILHVDEEGIFTMYQFYLPWKYIDSFYIKGEEFIEIKLKDNEKYVSEMDPDMYAVYYDEIELAHMHGHELFYFPVQYMELDCEETLKFFNEAKKKYSK